MTKKTMCRICEQTNQNEIYIGKEMMYGTKEKYEYFQCSNCDCLQMTKIPNDLSKFYPKKTYYSFNNDNLVFYKNPIKNLYKFIKDNLVLQLFHFLPKILEGKDLIVNDGLRSVAKLKNINHNSRILDIGCGSGVLVYRLHNAGFKYTFGNDPFAKEVKDKYNRLLISNQPLNSIKEKYDIIMMHHALEHVPDPIDVLKNISRLLNKDGQVLIRIPYVDSYCWDKYREDWLQMDPPRHLYLHSKKSIQIILQKSGLQQDKIVFDSNELPMIGSDQYENGIAMTAENSYFINPQKSTILSAKVSEYRLLANKLNLQGKGDQVCLYLSLA
jgi:SAM-dependent methyltransferase